MHIEATIRFSKPIASPSEANSHHASKVVAVAFGRQFGNYYCKAPRTDGPTDIETPLSLPPSESAYSKCIIGSKCLN